MSSEATVFIVEDDPLLSKQLREDCEGLGFWVIGHAADSESALDKIIRSDPDIILMDIDIEGSLDGVQLSKIILSKEIKSTVIFLTSNDDDHSFEIAMESKPFDFLSKPVSPRRLKRTIQLALQSKSQKESSKEDWTIKDGRILHRIKISDIGFVESQDKYCMFHFENGQKELIRITLNEVMRNLDPEMFFQVHRSFLVNLSLVSKFDVSSSEIYLTHQNRIPVSRKFKEELIHRLR